MRLKKWISTAAAAALMATTLAFAPVQADEKQERTMIDESIYDLLIDRYFNGSGTNDQDVNTLDIEAFAGGDFAGLISRGDHLINLGYTMISIGSVFPTERYDGSMVTTYEGFEPHFGTEEEFQDVLTYYRGKNTGVMVDFPMSNVSPNHEWAKANPNWVAGNTNGQVQFDLTNADVQKAMKDRIVKFVETYDIQGLRLTGIESADTAFLNEVIAAVKAVKDIYVIANSESDADFDAAFRADLADILTNAYKNYDLSAADVVKYAEAGGKPSLNAFDTIWSDRITLAITSPEGNDYPPNRLPLAVAATLFMHGVPMTTYGSEIGMNGAAGPEAHQLYNFKTNDELIKQISDMQYLRNSSWTLRNGDFKVLENKDGLLVMKRSSEDETWIIMINNTAVTQRVDVPVAEIGEKKEIRGMFESEIMRANPDGHYPIILDREKVEIYQVIDEKGFNTSYIVALAIVYVLFTAFVVIVVKRGRKRRAQQDAMK